MINKSVGFKVLILPLATVFVVMMSVLYIKPAYDEMQLLKKAQAEKQSQLANLQKQNQKLAELKIKWNSMENEKTLTQTALPAESEMENYMSELYGRASRSGVLLTSITSSEKGFIAGANSCDSASSPVDSTSAPSSFSPAAAGKTSSKASQTDNISPIGITDDSTAASQSCANAASVQLDVSGNWDQIVNFFKYLEDTNRIANITSVDISASTQNISGEQAPSDLLSATIELSVFYKAKSGVGENSNSINSLTSGKGFEENVIKKLNEIIFTPYVAPVVSVSGERNIFK